MGNTSLQEGKLFLVCRPSVHDVYTWTLDRQYLNWHSVKKLVEQTFASLWSIKITAEAKLERLGVYLDGGQIQPYFGHDQQVCSLSGLTAALVYFLANLSASQDFTKISAC